jgi:hypothetical protein
MFDDFYPGAGSAGALSLGTGSLGPGSMGPGSDVDSEWTVRDPADEVRTELGAEDEDQEEMIDEDEELFDRFDAQYLHDTYLGGRASTRDSEEGTGQKEMDQAVFGNISPQKLHILLSLQAKYAATGDEKQRKDVSDYFMRRRAFLKVQWLKPSNKTV